MHAGILDITRPLGPATAPWPGDPALEIRPVTALSPEAPDRAGATATRTTAVCFCLHHATHLDAPAHVLEHGATVEALPLDLFLGPAVVLELKGQGPVTAGELAAAAGPGTVPGAARVLLKTGYDPAPGGFATDYRPLAPEAARWIAECWAGAGGVRLLGLDTPSPDPFDSVDLPAHRILLGAAVPLLENLDLAGVPAGTYELACLPLLLPGLEASPVRAVLRTGGPPPETCRVPETAATKNEE